MKGLNSMQLSIQKCIRYITNGDYRFMVNCNHGMYKSMPDDIYLKRLFKAKLGVDLNLSDPKTFNEKIQWLKLFDRKPEYTAIVDKYAVKKWVAGRIGEEYIIPTLGVWDHFDEINFDALPDQFVLKCTHDSGGLVIVKDKNQFDRKAAKKKLEKHLRRNYYFGTREWPYKNVKPRVIAEPYIEDNQTKELRDYKFYTFNGAPKMMFISTGRGSASGLKLDYFDMDGNHMGITHVGVYPNAGVCPDLPENFELMKYLAEKLAKKFAFVRVDFYEANHKVLFGELTLHSGAGYDSFRPDEWNYIVGNWLKLPKG